MEIAGLASRGLTFRGKCRETARAHREAWGPPAPHHPTCDDWTMNIADLMELLKQHDPLMRVVVADAISVFSAHAEDLRVVDLSNGKALLIAPFEFVESWDAGASSAVMKPSK